MRGGFVNKFRLLCGSKVLATFIAINIAVSGVLWLAAIIGFYVHTNEFSLSAWLSIPSSFEVFLGRPWTLLTYMVTQSSPLHLLFNVLWLYWFGRILLLKFTDKGLLTCYIGGGLAGGVAYIVATSAGVAAAGYLCGASASVLSIMCCVALALPDYELNLFIFGRVKMKWFALVCAVLILIGTAGSEAATIAHAGGMAFGLLYGLKPQFSFKLNPDFKKKFKPEKRSRPKDAGAAIKAMQGRLCDHDRLDQLLDKIRLSGYSSLSDDERRELDALSSRLK